MERKSNEMLNDNFKGNQKDDDVYWDKDFGPAFSTYCANNFLMESYKIAMFSYRNEKSGVSSESSDDEDDVLKKIETNKPAEESKTNLPMMDVPFDNTATTSTTIATTIPKRKVNHVWTTVMSENLLSEDLDQFALKMKHFKGNRSVETYDYTTANKFSLGKPELLKIFTGTPNAPTTKEFYEKQKEKRKESFVVGKEEAEKVSKIIAAKLNEPNQKLIYRTVRVLGTKKTMDTLQSVEEIEKNGGMKVLDGSRRRTPGGIYLYLLKSNPLIERSFKNYIFDESYVQHKRLKKSQLKMNEKFQSKKKSLRKNSKKRSKKNKKGLKPLPTQLELLLSTNNSDDSLPTSGTAESTSTSSSSTTSNSVSPDDTEVMKNDTRDDENACSGTELKFAVKTEMEQDSEIEDGEILD